MTGTCLGIAQRIMTHMQSRSDATKRAIEDAAHLEDWDQVLAALRAEEFSKTDCVRTTAEARSLPLAEAKRLVHESEAWSDVRKRDEPLLDQLEKDLADRSTRLGPEEQS